MYASPKQNILYFLLILISCNSKSPENSVVFYDTVVGRLPVSDSISIKPITPITLAITNTSRESIVTFATSLKGVPYKYASTDPVEGFDCSGFITFVFNHFNIKVPRSSVDFTNVGREVQLKNAKPGDLILFTGTDSLVKIVGHMGIVSDNADTLKFIHSTSGKMFGVTETPLNSYYQKRFVKVIDIF